jgi:hypothetical protein
MAVLYRSANGEMEGKNAYSNSRMAIFTALGMTAALCSKVCSKA